MADSAAQLNSMLGVSEVANSSCAMLRGQPMLAWIDKNLLELLTLLVGVVGILLLLRSLSHSRSANFSSVWQDISKHLQSIEVVPGRVLLRCLYQERQGHPASDKDILDAYERLRSDYSGAEWYTSIDNALHAKNDADRIAFLKTRMIEAYGAFDLVAIQAIHSRIPKLLLRLAKHPDGN